MKTYTADEVARMLAAYITGLALIPDGLHIARTAFDRDIKRCLTKYLVVPDEEEAAA